MYYDHEIRPAPTMGWQGGPMLNTRIQTLQSGQERRTGLAAAVRHQYSLPLAAMLDDEYRQYLKGFFLAMRGQLHSFKVQDRADYRAVQEPLGAAPSGTTAVQLVKVSTYGAASYTRTITKPRAGSVTVYQNTGSGPVAKPGTMDVLTGLFTPTTAWTAGAALTWSGEFYVPVRFNSDTLLMTIDARTPGGYAMTGDIELIEVFGE